MTVRRTTLALAAAVALLLGAGCGGDTAPMIAEVDEPAFHEGQQRLKEGRAAEALTWFLKVIEKRGLQNAAESHLEVGRIYLQHIKDPNYAYYHFRKYLELQPNSQQAPLVRQQVDAALREFAARLPLHPEDNQVNNQVKLDSARELVQLQKENVELKARIATLQGGGGMMPLPRSGRTISPPDLSRPIVATPADESPITAAPPRAATPPIQRSAPSQRSAPIASAPPPTAAPTAGRTHKVQPSEGLFAIARRFEPVNTSRKVKEIVEANPDVLPQGERTPLKPGMVLRIP